MTDPKTGPHGIIITQREVYEKVEEIDERLDKLVIAVEQMAAINKRLDQHHDRQNAHAERLRALEAKVLAQAVIIGIMTAAITALVVKALS